MAFSNNKDPKDSSSMHPILRTSSYIWKMKTTADSIDMYCEQANSDVITKDQRIYDILKLSRQFKLSTCS